MIFTCLSSCYVSLDMSLSLLPSNLGWVGCGDGKNGSTLKQTGFDFGPPRPRARTRCAPKGSAGLRSNARVILNECNRLLEPVTIQGIQQLSKIRLAFPAVVHHQRMQIEGEYWPKVAVAKTRHPDADFNDKH